MEAIKSVSIWLGLLVLLGFIVPLGIGYIWIDVLKWVVPGTWEEANIGQMIELPFLTYLVYRAYLR